jgi:hypothetical protein
MKALSCLLLIVVLIALSCQKKKVIDKYSATGTYTGRSEVRSNNLEQIFTGPETSYFEWVSDSVFNDTDLLIVNNLSVDSFELAGPMAMHFPDYWRRLAWEELQYADTAHVLNKYLSAPGYFTEGLEVSFSIDGKHVTANYDRTTTTSHSTVVFNGSK